MPLDPQIAGILALFDQIGAPSITSGSPEQARALFRASTVDIRDPASLAPVRSVVDSTIPGPAGEIPVRIYAPDVDGPVPTMAFFHGGGFVIGDLDTHDDQVRLLCRDVEIAVVSVDYRLAPEHKFPAGYDDCLAATRWVAAHAGELGGDPDRILVGGDSAGGNLAAAVALATRHSGPAITAQFLIYPGVDFVEDADYPSRLENAEGYYLTLEEMLWFGDHYLDPSTDRADPRCSPIHATDLAGTPPAIIGTAEFDPLRDEGEAYAKALANAGVDARLQRYDGMIHGYYGLGVYSAGAANAVAAMNAALNDLLAGR